MWFLSDSKYFKQLNNLREHAGSWPENSLNGHSLRNSWPWLTKNLIDMKLKIQLWGM